MTSLAAELEAAAQIGADGGGVSRFAWSPELAQANAWLMRRLEDLGLETELDPAGNVFGRWDAGEGEAVLVGSHLDTVPRGGRYDGALGRAGCPRNRSRPARRRRRAEAAPLGRVLQRRGGQPLPDRDARQPRLLRRARPRGLAPPRRRRRDGARRLRLRSPDPRRAESTGSAPTSSSTSSRAPFSSRAERTWASSRRSPGSSASA